MKASQKNKTEPKALPSKGPNTFINGRGQIIEMLQFMDSQEKGRLLEQIKLRNPQMALELSQQSLSFNHLENLPDEDLRLLQNQIAPEIWGMALKESPLRFQKRFLRLVPKQYAQKAFEILQANLANEKRDCRKAQTKILQIALQMFQKRKFGSI